MIEKCTALCCEKFSMSSTPEQRIRSIAAEKAGLSTFIDEDGTEKRMVCDDAQTVEFIHDMLIELPPEPHGIRLYTCKHFDTETRLCTVYDIRPGLCRRYPDEKGCQHGCNFVNPLNTNIK